MQCRVIDKAKSNYNSALGAFRHALNTIYSESSVETSLPAFVHFWVIEVVLSEEETVITAMCLINGGEIFI